MEEDLNKVWTSNSLPIFLLHAFEKWAHTRTIEECLKEDDVELSLDDIKKMGGSEQHYWMLLNYEMFSRVLSASIYSWSTILGKSSFKK